MSQKKIDLNKILEIIAKDFDEQWVQYYKLDGGKLGVDSKMRINYERIKKKILRVI